MEPGHYNINTQYLGSKINENTTFLDARSRIEWVQQFTFFYCAEVVASPLTLCEGQYQY